jgi:hypothetical protein
VRPSGPAGAAAAPTSAASRVVSEPGTRGSPCSRSRAARATPTEGSRSLLQSGLVDRRLVALIGYLDQVLGGVRVTSVAQPRLDLAAPLATAHAQGRAIAIDIDGEGKKGTRIARAVRELLALPRELQPARIVSTLRVGRPAELHLAY